MDIGTADIIEEVNPKKKTRRATFGGSNSPNGGGRNNGGGGGDGNDDGDKPSEGSLDETEQHVPNKSRILTAFVLLVVLMTFGGLVTAYVVLATNNVAEWKPFDLPIQLWISTALILASSVTYHFAKTSIDINDQAAAKKYLLVTTILGAAFISSQVLVWIVLTGRGVYMSGNPFAGLFYFMTGLHAAHVLGGIAALGAVVLRTWRPTENPNAIIQRRTLAQVVGWYWHFMGALWIVLFILLGFWR